jgi:hypothetical protein
MTETLSLNESLTREQQLQRAVSQGGIVQTFAEERKRMSQRIENESLSLDSMAQSLSDAYSSSVVGQTEGVQQRKQVKILYTGGTMGMKPNETGALQPAPGYLTEQIGSLQELQNSTMPSISIEECGPLSLSFSLLPSSVDISRGMILLILSPQLYFGLVLLQVRPNYRQFRHDCR